MFHFIQFSTYFGLKSTKKSLLNCLCKSRVIICCLTPNGQRWATLKLVPGALLHLSDGGKSRHLGHLTLLSQAQPWGTWWKVGQPGLQSALMWDVSVAISGFTHNATVSTLRSFFIIRFTIKQFLPNKFLVFIFIHSLIWGYYHLSNTILIIWLSNLFQSSPII